MEHIKDVLSRQKQYPNNNDKVNDINTIDNDNIYINNNIDIDNYDIPDFKPSNRNEQIAIDVAIQFEDRKNLKLYISYVNKLGYDKFKTIFDRVLRQPKGKIRNFGAYFNYIARKESKK